MQRWLTLAILFVAPASACAAGGAPVFPRRNAVVAAVEKAGPGVVNISTEQVVVRRSNPFFRFRDPSQDDLFREYFGRFSRPRRFRTTSLGSGVIVDPDGYVVTNEHVVRRASKIHLTLGDGRKLEGRLLSSDPDSDLALIKVDGDKPLPTVAMGHSDDLMIGETMVALGNPFGLESTVTVGVLSAKNRSVMLRGQEAYAGLMQTDAAINPGNSGGPLINAEGEVIGVNTMIFSTSGANVGLGFALPINRVRRVAEEIIRYGRRRDPWPGFKVEDITALRRDLREQLGLQVDQGGIVVNILTSAPAYVAGLRPGDAILAINGEPVSSSSDVDFVIWDLFVGDDCEIKIDRQGKRQTIRFEISELENRG